MFISTVLTCNRVTNKLTLNFDSLTLTLRVYFQIQKRIGRRDPPNERNRRPHQENVRFVRAEPREAAPISRPPLHLRHASAVRAGPRCAGERDRRDLVACQDFCC